MFIVIKYFLLLLQLVGIFSVYFTDDTFHEYMTMFFAFHGTMLLSSFLLCSNRPNSVADVIRTLLGYTISIANSFMLCQLGGYWFINLLWN